MLRRKGTFPWKKRHFFEERAQKSPHNLNIFFSVLHQNKALHNFCKRGYLAIIEPNIGLEYAMIRWILRLVPAWFQTPLQTNDTQLLLSFTNISKTEHHFSSILEGEDSHVILSKHQVMLPKHLCKKLMVVQQNLKDWWFIVHMILKILEEGMQSLNSICRKVKFYIHSFPWL